MTEWLVRLLCVAIMPVLSLAVGEEVGHPPFRGVVLLNGTMMSNATAIFPGDSLETDRLSSATMSGADLNLYVFPNSYVSFERGSIDVRRGTVVLTTSKALDVDRIMIIPTSRSYKEIRINRDGEAITFVARKGDININDGVHTKLLAEGQRTTFQELPPHKTSGASPSATQKVDQKTLAAIGVAGIGGAGLWIVLRDPAPVSPFVP